MSVKFVWHIGRVSRRGIAELLQRSVEADDVARITGDLHVMTADAHVAQKTKSTRCSPSVAEFLSNADQINLIKSYFAG